MSGTKSKDKKSLFHAPQIHTPITNYKNIQVPISAVSTSSHSEQRSQARQSRWYCGKTWESRSVPNHIKYRPFANALGLSCLKILRFPPVMYRFCIIKLITTPYIYPLR